jgi:hypothetical protein
MKRFFFSVMALAAVATACTESGLIDKPSFYANEISFDSYIGKAPQTKAETVDETYLQRTIANGGGVHVYGFLQEKGVTSASSIETSVPYMDAQLRYDIPEGASSQAWMYDDIAFWPEDKALAFAAYSLNAETNGCISNHTDVTKFDFTVNDLVEDQVDLLAIPFMTNKVDAGENNVVTLEFKHLLSRVGFTVLASHPSEDVDIAIQSIVLRGIFPKTGVVDLTSTGIIAPYYDGEVATEYDFFKDADDNTEAGFMINSSTCVADQSTNKKGEPIYPNVTMDLDLDPKDQTKWNTMYAAMSGTSKVNDRYMMIMPCTVDAVIEVKYHLTADQPRIAKVALTNWEFKPGYAYEFVLKVSTQTIQFDADFGAWGGPITETQTLTPII